MEEGRRNLKRRNETVWNHSAPVTGVQTAVDRSVRTRPRQRLDAARRDDLLTRVVDIFLSNGFSSVTVSAFAQQLWCSKAMLYSVAPTKEQLVNLATRQFFGSPAERIIYRVAFVHAAGGR